jgi:LacI family transcriptional regulator/LacI family repressor for deo operon, udp, cdd, tsx, nupC, and nupG
MIFILRCTRAHHPQGSVPGLVRWRGRRFLDQNEVSIADIARLAGVSHSTVSRALRESPLISGATRERIQRLAQEMGYTPNAIAQSLQTRHTSTIGLVVTSIADPFLIDVVKGVEEVAREATFSVFLSTSHNNPEQEMAVIETFRHRRVDGILVASSRLTSAYKERLASLQMPTVLINSQAESQDGVLHWVAVDDYAGAKLAVAHLLELRHRAIGYLGVGSRPRSCRQRLEGYRSALSEAGIEARAEWIVTVPCEEASPEEDIAAGQSALPRLLEAGVTAVFCANDMIAVGVLMAARARGLILPEQLSVVGFDDVPAASYVLPPLTTINQPKVELGRLATQLMLDLLQDQPGRNHTLQPTLVHRGSTTRFTGA